MSVNVNRGVDFEANFLTANVSVAPKILAALTSFPVKECLTAGGAISQVSNWISSKINTQLCASQALEKSKNNNYAVLSSDLKKDTLFWEIKKQ